MSAPESRLKADFGLPVISAEVREVRRIAFDGKEIAEQFERYKTREDLEQAFGETKKRESQLRQFIDTIPTLAWCNLPDGSNEFLNQRWHDYTDYTGLSPEDAHGWGWKATIHPDDLSNLMDKWGILLASGESGEIEARLQRYDGEYHWFLFRIEPLRDEFGSIVRWYGTNTDIEDLKRQRRKGTVVTHDARYGALQSHRSARPLGALQLQFREASDQRSACFKVVRRSDDPRSRPTR